MVVGIITLITILFGPGSMDLFFVQNIDKGVKEYVIEKDRQKEILADLKETEKSLKAYNKERKSDISGFQDMNKSRLSTEEDFNLYFLEVQSARESMQNKTIDNRISILNKIEQSEWDSIVASSKSYVDEINEKAQKKADKKKGKSDKKLFDECRTSILENVTAEDKQKEIIIGLDVLTASFIELVINLESISVNDNPEIVRKDASKEELLELAKEVNDIRLLVYQELVVFHMIVKENTNQEEWDKVMKVFNKELAITNH